MQSLSDKQLAYWYAKYNKRWFGDALPKDTIIYWQPPPGAHADTCPVFEVADGKFEIRMDPAIMGMKKFWHIILLHEMNHIHVWPRHPRHQHGKAFQEGMQRLATAGAFKKLW